VILDDNPKLLDQSLFMLNKFTECPGVNIVPWLAWLKADLPWTICFHGTFTGKFKLLGITFNLSEYDKTPGNFTEKV
jgi:hypothetical protein